MDRKIIVNSNCYHGYDVETAIKEISKLGFKYIELTATKGWTEHVYSDHSFKQLQKVKDLLDEYNLIPIGFSGHTSLMDSSRREDFINNIHLAHFFNAEHIITSVGEAHLEDVEDTGDELIVENIKSFIPYLEKYDMKMSVEVHGKDHGTGLILKDLLSPIDSERVSVAYDTGNAIFYGNTDPVTDLKKSVDRVGYVHIKEKAGADDVWDFPALGEGKVDFKEFIKVLDDSNNDSPLSIEIEFTEKGPQDLNEINEALKTSKEYLEQLGMRIS